MALSEMGDLRLIGLSLYYAIQETLSIAVQGEVLQNPSQDQQTYVSAHNNWLPTFPVTIYVNGVPTTHCTVYFSGGIGSGSYPGGTVVFPAPVSGTVTADYQLGIANVFDDYPDFDLVRPIFQFPAVSIQFGQVTDIPFELGPNAWAYECEVLLDIWARTSGQRNDLANALRHRFNGGILWVDYNQGFPITPSGTLNPLFNALQQAVGWIDKESWSMQPLRDERLGEIGRHRMAIDCVLLAARSAPASGTYY